MKQGRGIDHTHRTLRNFIEYFTAAVNTTHSVPGCRFIVKFSKVLKYELVLVYFPCKKWKELHNNGHVYYLYTSTR